MATTGEPGTRAHYRVTFVVLATGVMAYALLQSLVIPVLPPIQHGLHSTQNTVTWVLTGYLLSASVFTPIVGRLGDMWGSSGCWWRHWRDSSWGACSPPWLPRLAS